MRKLLVYMKDYKKESFLAPLFKLLEATFELIVPLVIAQIIDVGIQTGDTGFIISRCLLLVGFGVVGMVSAITAQYFAAKAAIGFTAGVRHAVFQKVQSLSYAELDRLGTSTLMTRMTSDMNQVQTGLNLALRLLLRSPFVVFGAMIMAFTIDVKSAWVFAVIIPLLFAVVFAIMFSCIPLYRRVQGRLDGVLGAAKENLAGVRVIRAFGKERQEVKSFEEKSGALLSSQLFVGKISALLNPVTYVMINLAVVVILNTGAVQIHLGNMQQGDVVALVNYMNQILIELVKLANLIIQVTKAMACAERVASVLNVEPEMEFSCPKNNAKNRKTGTSDEEVAFDHVSFTYGGAGAETLSNIHFTVKKGQTVGIIGGTGSGKSTLVNLLARFYDATDGQIRIGGHDIRSYSREELRGKIGMVMQKAQLFSGTIRSNLLWGNPGATDEMLWAALETAQAAEFVQKKEKQLDEPVEQGGRNLSGGQKQRLTIARALVEDPEILILDDSASALDFATDAALRKAIRELDKEMTVFIVSQRTSSLMHADLILVLDDGKTVGMGTHEELLGNCPVYQEIYESQFGKAGETA